MVIGTKNEYIRIYKMFCLPSWYGPKVSNIFEPLMSFDSALWFEKKKKTDQTKVTSYKSLHCVSYMALCSLCLVLCQYMPTNPANFQWTSKNSDNERFTSDASFRKIGAWLVFEGNRSVHTKWTYLQRLWLISRCHVSWVMFLLMLSSLMYISYIYKEYTYMKV